MPIARVQRWNGGMSDDPRVRAEGACRVSTGFDTLIDEHSIRPLRDSEDGDVVASTSKKQTFELALRTGTTYSLYALGVVSGTGRAEILYKDLTVGVATDLSDNAWATPLNNQSPSGATAFELFTFYETTGLIYGARNNAIWTFDPTGGAFNNTERSITYTNIARGLVHPKDDILYIPYDNKIAKNNNGSWTDVALTLPASLVIRSITSYGNFLAIGCAPLSGIGNSVVYLWDRDASLVTLSERIDWAEGDLKVLHEIEGFLIGINFSGARDSRFTDRVIFSQYGGTLGAVKFEQFVGGTITQLPIAKQAANKKLYFMLKMSLNGETREGVWSIGRLNAQSSFAVNQEMPLENSASTNTTLQGFFVVEDFIFQAFIAEDTPVNKVTKTDDTATFTSSRVRETLINPGMVEADRHKKKQLQGAKLIYTKKLASGEEAMLKYRMDGDTFQTIFTETEAGIIFSEAKTDASKQQFDKGTDIEFRLESKGGIEIATLIYDYDIIETQVG